MNGAINEHDDNTAAINHISLCTGYAGIDLGLKRVLPGLRTIAYVEIEAFAVSNLASKIEAGCLDAAPIYTDLHGFPFSKFHGLGGAAYGAASRVDRLRLLGNGVVPATAARAFTVLMGRLLGLLIWSRLWFILEPEQLELITARLA